MPLFPASQRLIRRSPHCTVILPAFALRRSIVAESTPPIVNIIGEKVALGPLRREVIDEFDIQWGNDFAVTVTTGRQPFPITAEMVAARYERILHAEPELWFLIYERATWRPIGLTYFSQMNRIHQTAEFN